MVRTEYPRESGGRRADRIPALARKGPPASQGMGPFSASIRNAISRHEPSTGSSAGHPLQIPVPSYRWHRKMPRAGFARLRRVGLLLLAVREAAMVMMVASDRSQHQL